MTFKLKNRHRARIMEASTIHLPMHSDTLMCDVSSGHYFSQVSKHHTPSLRQSGLIHSSWVSGVFFFLSLSHEGLVELGVQLVISQTRMFRGPEPGPVMSKLRAVASSLF